MGNPIKNRIGKWREHMQKNKLKFNTVKNRAAGGSINIVILRLLM